MARPTSVGPGLRSSGKFKQQGRRYGPNPLKRSRSFGRGLPSLSQRIHPLISRPFCLRKYRHRNSGQLARDALPANVTTVAPLADELAKRKQELNALLEADLARADAAA